MKMKIRHISILKTLLGKKPARCQDGALYKETAMTVTPFLDPVSRKLNHVKDYWRSLNFGCVALRAQVEPGGLGDVIDCAFLGENKAHQHRLRVAGGSVQKLSTLILTGQSLSALFQNRQEATLALTPFWEKPQIMTFTVNAPNVSGKMLLMPLSSGNQQVVDRVLGVIAFAAEPQGHLTLGAVESEDVLFGPTRLPRKTDLPSVPKRAPILGHIPYIEKPKPTYSGKNPPPYLRVVSSENTQDS